MLDVALLVPLQSRPSAWGDSGLRALIAPTERVAIRARDRFLENLGVPIELDDAFQRGAHRSLTAVTLATSLERAGLRWRAIDPGWLPLPAWRARLAALRPDRPRLVALSTTFATDAVWIATLCELVRKLLPQSRLAVGGYYYATDAKSFLSLDADILCVGEGEKRIVSIARAVRDGAPLDDIPGLYLRDSLGRLRYTGDVEPLVLDELPLPDWSLSTRMDPPVDPDREALDYATETQRGCVFKCEFCTFRTLAAPALGSVDRAVERILDVAARPRGSVSLIDATATYPRDRWRRILEQLIAGGGGSASISIYARVTDIDDEICALMARAGVRMVRIGQESGDQGMLNRMRKGTRVDHVAPAIAALGRHGIRATVFMIYGFPGESAESLAATRRMLVTFNDGHADFPVVHSARILLFDHQDFAGVHQHEALPSTLRYRWNGAEISPAHAWQAALETYLEMSRIPHAPCSGFYAGHMLWRFFGRAPDIHYDPEFFRWAKVIDRGMGFFVEQELEGKRPPARELAQVREAILAKLPPELYRRGALRDAVRRARNRAAWRLIDESAREPHAGIGPLTRVALAVDVARATGSPRHVLDAMRTGRYPCLGLVEPKEGAELLRAASDQLIRFGVATGRRRLPRA